MSKETMTMINGKITAGRRSLRIGKLGLLVSLAAVCAGMLATAAPAFGAPVLDLKTRWAPSHLPPGGEGTFILQAKNFGDMPTDGSPVTIVDELPAGVTATGFRVDRNAPWFCSGATTVTCETTEAIAQRDEFAQGYARRIHVEVSVAAGASGMGLNTATISGGGAEASASDMDSVTFSSSPSGFGIVPGSFEADVFDARYPAGSPSRQAGSHPYELRVGFDFNLKRGVHPTHGAYTTPDEHVRTVETILPRGLIGNPEATPKCKGTDFLVSPGGLSNITGCPPNTQIGSMDLQLSEGESDGPNNIFHSGVFVRMPVYNLVPPKGAPADFGFSVLGVVSGHVIPQLDPAHGYAIKAVVSDASAFQFVREAKFTMWGVPADPAHDILRANVQTDGFNTAIHASTMKPFLTLTSECGAPGQFLTRADSWQQPGVWTPTEAGPNPPFEATGCEDPRIRFEPEVSLQPTNRDAGGPTGLQVDLEVPQRDDTVQDVGDLYNQSGDVQAIATPPMKKAVVTFPEGMTISTSAAQGLGNCSAAQIGIGTDSPVTCPDNSRYGSVTLHTPILPKDAPMVGDIYIAKQHDNPFHNFLSMYFVIHDEQRGLLVKVPGKIELDPVSGQITTTFDDLPQFPISDMQLNFKSGVRAALVNPGTCGAKTIRAEFFSWSDPSTPVVVNDSYEVTQKPDGTPCVANLGERPFNPQLAAGTLSPMAGTYSPFVFRLTRTDEDQEFSQLNVTLPPGLLANISTISKCSEGGIAQAEAHARTGTEEMANPSCPASSQIGVTQVGTGVGVPLTYVPGKAYFAGPYRGAPLSMVVITPAVVGPYDLGVIAVRSAIHVNRETAQASIATDPFPQIFEGIPVRIRDIRVKVDRPDTMINPTSCNPMAVDARITGTGGDVDSTADDVAADLSQHFQAVNCLNLGFKPKLGFRLKGGTDRGDFPAFQATLRARPGDANIARTVVTLPPSQFLEQAHIRTVCTRVQFAQGSCPANSVYGHASATSPLFGQTLEGPVYLRSNGGERLLPDLVASLEGEVNVVLQGYIDTARKRIRNTFNVVPDAPVTKFTLTMRGGKNGLLVNSRNLCISPSRASVRLVAQNGKTSQSRPKLATSCKRRARKSDR